MKSLAINNIDGWYFSKLLGSGIVLVLRCEPRVQQFEPFLENLERLRLIYNDCREKSIYTTNRP